MIYDTNTDLVKDNVFTKFDLNESICFQDIDQKLNLMSIKGRISVANLQKFVLIQAFMYVLVTCKNEEDLIKNEGARVITNFSNYKSMGIFRFGQGQLTPQPLVRSASNSNSVLTLRLSSLPERIKKIQSKM